MMKRFYVKKYFGYSPGSSGYRKLMIVILLYSPRVQFDNKYFEKLILKLKEINKNFFLPCIFLSRQIEMKAST